jgi:hypothetical protein
VRNLQEGNRLLPVSFLRRSGTTEVALHVAQYLLLFQDLFSVAESCFTVIHLVFVEHASVIVILNVSP